MSITAGGLGGAGPIVTRGYGLTTPAEPGDIAALVTAGGSVALAMLEGIGTSPPVVEAQGGGRATYYPLRPRTTYADLAAVVTGAGSVALADLESFTAAESVRRLVEDELILLELV